MSVMPRADQGAAVMIGRGEREGESAGTGCLDCSESRKGGGK